MGKGVPWSEDHAGLGGWTKGGGIEATYGGGNDGGLGRWKKKGGTGAFIHGDRLSYGDRLPVGMVSSSIEQKKLIT